MSLRRVIVIDDDPVYALLCKHALGTLFELECVDDSRKVPVDWLKTVDFIVLDLKLQGNRDGIVEIRHLARVCPQAAVVIVSGAREKVVKMAVETAISHGFQVLGHLEKPLDIDALRLILTQAQITNADTHLQPKAGDFAPILDRAITADDVRVGIENNEFVAFFQPQIDLRNGLVCGLEALSRWDHPKYGTLTPNFFLDVIESVEMGVEFSLNILELALHGLQTIQNDAGYAGTVSINVPMNAFCDPLFPEKVLSLLARRQVEPCKLIIEITEYGSLDGLHHVQESIARVMIRGIGLSIDDFGTGYSGLSRLRTLGFDELKVDRQFLTNLHNDIASQSSLIAMADIARALKMSIVVEGLETRQTLEWLMKHQEIICQGYLIARPMRLTPLIDWFNSVCNNFALDLNAYLRDGVDVNAQSVPEKLQAIAVVDDPERLGKIMTSIHMLDGEWSVQGFMKKDFFKQSLFDKGQEVNLAVIDLDIGANDSILLISEVRRRYPDCAIVGISKALADSAIVSASEHGVNAFADHAESEATLSGILSTAIAANTSFSSKLVESLFSQDTNERLYPERSPDFNPTAR